MAQLQPVFYCLQVQRLYERYLRAESFRKALVYQKRYLLLLLGGFQECEQATLCLIAHMGARPSPPLSSQNRPLGRFRAAVRVVIAVSRLVKDVKSSDLPQPCVCGKNWSHYCFFFQNEVPDQEMAESDQKIIYQWTCSRSAPWTCFMSICITCVFMHGWIFNLNVSYRT